MRSIDRRSLRWLAPDRASSLRRLLPEDISIDLDLDEHAPEMAGLVLIAAPAASVRADAEAAA